MSHLDQKLDMIQECIQKGERVRVLYQILLSELGMSFENEGREVFQKLAQSQDEYYEAVQLLKTIVESGREQKQDTEINMDENYIENILKKEVGVS